MDLDRLVEGKGKDKLLVTVGLEELGTCKQNNIMFKVWLGFPEIYLVCLMEQVPTCMKASRIGVFIIFVKTFCALSTHKCIQLYHSLKEVLLGGTWQEFEGHV